MKTSLTSGTTSSIDRPRFSTPSWFEWAVALFSTWFVVGLYLDGWAGHRSHLQATCQMT